MSDLKEIYGSKGAHLPELLDRFGTGISVDTMIEQDDNQLINGFREVARRFDIQYEGTYFIVDIGAAHLPGVALDLLRKGIDCSFYLPHNAINRLDETSRYFAKEYERAKASMERPKGYASMIDIHRNDSNRSGELPESAFPTAEKLQRLGINNVVYLCEASVGKLAETWEELLQNDSSRVSQRGEYCDTLIKLDLSKIIQIDPSKIIQTYLSKISVPQGRIVVDYDVDRYLDILRQIGFEIKMYGIDLRQGRV